jgi:hypothetical protein
MTVLMGWQQRMHPQPYVPFRRKAKKLSAVKCTALEQNIKRQNR